MPTVTIQLNPDLLKNPDLDIRYELPEKIAASSDLLLSDDGYDYGRTTSRLTIFMFTKDLAAAVAFVLKFLEAEIMGNHLLQQGVIVASATSDHCEFEQDYIVVFPCGSNSFSLE